MTHLAWLRERDARKTTDHYFLASIAYQVYLLSWKVGNLLADKDEVEDPVLGFDDFMFEFTEEGINRKKAKKAMSAPVETEEQKAERLKITARRSAWWGVGGGGKKGKAKPPPPLPPEVIKKTKRNLDKKAKKPKE